MKKVCIITLGCKTNQYESEALGELLEKEGYEVSYKFGVADIYVLNTCAVTNEAERKSRQTIAKFVKLNPKCKIYVCGCASQHNSSQFDLMPNVKQVIGNANILSLLESIKKSKKRLASFELPSAYESISLSTSKNARAYVKIQDGCNRFCSYCLIPYLRGKSRSRDIVSILTETAMLVQNGAKEIVLTGVDISDYKIDNQPSLLKLLQELDKFGVRIRLGSLEPNLVQKDFVEGIGKLKNFCPHFHMSMQSGCTETLKRMNRHYDSRFFIERVKMLKSKFKNCAITTDLIVGFPGETQSEFNQTLKTIKKIGFAEMHVFPYSIRSGTTAHKLMQAKNKDYFEIPAEVKKERVKEVIAIAGHMKEKFIISQKNLLEAVIEEEKDGFLIGTTENYIKVYIKNNDKSLVETLQKIKIVQPFKDGALAIIEK